MMRFYQEVTIGEGYRILLDGRPVKTRKKAILELPTRALAEAIVPEWEQQSGKVNPRTMPLTGLANGAMDIIQPNIQAYMDTIKRYAETDLLCYRAKHPAALATHQASQWDPLLQWAQTRYDIFFNIANGIMHTPQPNATVVRLQEALDVFTAFELAAIAPMITITGSVVIALATAEAACTPEQGYALATLDEQWQAQHWGEDSEARTALNNKRHEYLIATRFLSLLRA
jgi:chaperone required for assembly of F1-ATPase